jgi:hypothetical protein
MGCRATRVLRHVNVRFYRAFVVQIDDPNFCVLLPETVNTSDALLDPHGIPRQDINQGRGADFS